MINLKELMKQGLKDNMSNLGGKLENFSIVGEAGAGMVKVTMSGRREVTKLEIDDKIYGEGREVVEELAAAAMNDAIRKLEGVLREKVAEEMESNMNNLEEALGDMLKD